MSISKLDGHSVSHRLTSTMFDDATTSLMEELFAGENLLQIVLHGHLLIERALTERVAKKFTRPEVISGPNARWTFSQLVSMYIGLYAPEEDHIRLFRGINKLRNMAAHELNFDGATVSKCLPWEGEQHPQPPDPITHVKVAVTVLLFFELRAIDSIHRLDEPSAL
jgi:hypothetical protein